MRKRSLQEKLKVVPALSSLLVIAAAGTLLAIWVSQPRLKELAAITMKANASLGLLLAALSLWLLKDPPTPAARRRHLTGKCLALGVLLIGALTGLQYLSGASLGIDELLASDFINDESRLLPGRMSPIAALCFVFLGLALLSLDMPAKRARLHLASLFLAPVLLLSFQALVGYMYGASSFYQIGPYVRIAWQTSLCFLLLAIGVILSRPQSGPIAAITSTEAGGAMARVLLPTVILLPVALGWLRLEGQQRGWFGFEQGLALLVVALVVLSSSVIALNAKVLNQLGLERKELLERERKARQESEVEREKLRSLFLHAPAIITLMRGPEHVFELFNDEARKMVSGRDLTGLRIREALPELKGMGFFEALDRAYQTGEPLFLQETPAALKQADGTINNHYFNVVYRPWLDLDGKVAGILNVSMDVTEQVLARLRVEEALRARDEFLSIASHELKTPITTLKIHLQMTRRRIKPEQDIVPTAANLLRVLSVFDRQVDRLTALIEDMLDVARIRAGKLNFDLQPVNLASMIGDVVEQFADYLAAANSSVSVRVSDELSGQWDRRRLEQVFANLLTNAVMYAPGAAIEITATGTVGWVEITVRDEGPGISKENQATLFRRFERAGASRNVSGLGLGLYISKQIIDTHGGSIRIESEEGHGASFIFELPLSARQQPEGGRV